MIKAALTGGIATGKSHVLEQCRRRGVPCLDADALAHGVEAAGTEATRAIAARFGAGVSVSRCSGCSASGCAGFCAVRARPAINDSESARRAQVRLIDQSSSSYFLSSL